ncbi:ABC transporter permease [Microbacterium sp.]|uniref:ABC transporter permease n=1 Tax=Microbacterium sp. TaxID=51671 RepID=UPI003A8F912C
MTTALEPTPAAAPPVPSTRPAASDGVRLTFARLLRSETIKLLTLRSTWWSIIVVAVLSIGMSALIAAAIGSSAQGDASASIPMAVIAPIQFTMLLAGALGAIAITGEYSTGMIRSTLTAEPRRGGVLLSKAIVVTVLLGLVSLIVFALALIPVSLILNAAPFAAGVGETVQPILYAALSMAVFAVIGLAFGFILRNGPGAIAATVGLLFVLPIVGAIFPSEGTWSWIHDAAQYLPMSAAQALTVPVGTDGVLTVPVALITFGVWVAAGLVGAWAVLRSRDA